MVNATDKEAVSGSGSDICDRMMAFSYYISPFAPGLLLSITFQDILRYSHFPIVSIWIEIGQVSYLRS